MSAKKVKKKSHIKTGFSGKLGRSGIAPAGRVISGKTSSGKTSFGKPSSANANSSRSVAVKANFGGSDSGKSPSKMQTKMQNSNLHKPLKSSDWQQGNKIQKPLDDKLFIYGINPVINAINNPNRNIHQIFISKSINQQNLQNILTAVSPRILANSDLIQRVEEEKILEMIHRKSFYKAKSGNNSGSNVVHQGVLAICDYQVFSNQFDLLSKLHSLKLDEESLQKNPLPTLLMLDQITDPQNFGAIIRSAVAFGVYNIVIPEHNAVKETASVIKASAGNIEFAKIYIINNFSELIKKLKDLGYWVVGLEGTASDGIEKISNYRPLVIIAGSEGSGIRQLVKKSCDLLLKIDIDPQVESLNVGAATAIALHRVKSCL